jgi:hypothetical protein
MFNNSIKINKMKTHLSLQTTEHKIADNILVLNGMVITGNERLYNITHGHKLNLRNSTCIALLQSQQNLL